MSLKTWSVRIAHARAVHVALVREDHRRGHRADGFSVVLVMVADRAHDADQLEVGHPHLGEDLHRHDRAGLGVQTHYLVAPRLNIIAFFSFLPSERRTRRTRPHQ